MLKCLKCICCLLKCSKWLYFLKKIVCVAVFVMLAGAAVMCFSDKKECKKLLSKVKAVM